MGYRVYLTKTLPIDALTLRLALFVVAGAMVGGLNINLIYVYSKENGARIL